MVFIKEFFIKAVVLFLFLVVGFAIVQPFTSCGGESEFTCFKMKASELLFHR